MPLTFPGLDHAYQLTLQLYELDTIHEYVYFYHLADPKNEVPFSEEYSLNNAAAIELKKKEDRVHESHTVLANEIEQVVLTYSDSPFHYFFSTLTEILEKDDRIKSVDFDKIREEVAIHNQAALAFNASKDENDFTPYRYTINPVYLERYLIFLATVVISFKATIERHLKLYKEDKLKPHSTSASSKEQFPKLKFKLSVPQLAYLFRMLYDFGLLDDSNKQALYRFVNANLLSKETDETISQKNFGNHFANPEKSAADYWVSILKRMQNDASKV